jgi:hypothetical protein
MTHFTGPHDKLDPMQLGAKQLSALLIGIAHQAVEVPHAITKDDILSKANKYSNAVASARTCGLRARISLKPLLTDRGPVTSIAAEFQCDRRTPPSGSLGLRTAALCSCSSDHAITKEENSAKA